MTEAQIRHNGDENRYEALLDGQVAGFAEYEESADRIVFTHTEVDDAFGGRGVGGALARGALDDVRERGGLTVVPQCEFIAGWIAKHPEYADLLEA